MWWKNGWKVVRNDGEKLKSCFAGNVRVDSRGLPCGVAVEYEVGKITKKPVGGGPLAVFNAKEYASRFIRDNDGVTGARAWVIFPCRYVESEEETLYGAWYRLRTLPVGTVLAECVKLLDEKEGEK